ncbi:MAG TPA: tetraspanin family protein [Acidimicrobiales bacterium]|nr:tetraspanin family protein [Acidimicrobiales bacterium]
MPPSSDHEDRDVSSPTPGIRETFWPSAPPRNPEDLVPATDRKAVMASLDSLEVKLSVGALLLAFVAGIAIPAVIASEHRVTKHGKAAVTVAPDAWLLGGAIALLAVLGFVAIWRRKKTMVVFDLVFIGFAFTLFVGLVGFVYIFLGGWLFLRAWRIGKYGTTSGKVVARQSAEQRAARKGGAKQGAKTPTVSKASSPPAERKPPTASKRYTPKAAPKRKIPKPAK